MKTFIFLEAYKKKVIDVTVVVAEDYEKAIKLVLPLFEPEFYLEVETTKVAYHASLEAASTILDNQDLKKCPKLNLNELS